MERIISLNEFKFTSAQERYEERIKAKKAKLSEELSKASNDEEVFRVYFNNGYKWLKTLGEGCFTGIYKINFVNKLGLGIEGCSVEDSSPIQVEENEVIIVKYKELRRLKYKFLSSPPFILST